MKKLFTEFSLKKDWPVTIIMIVILVLAVLWVKDVDARDEKAETYRRQFIAFSGAMAEAVKKEEITEVFLREEQALEGVISFATAEYQEGVVSFRLYNVFPDGGITVYIRTTGDEGQVVKKSWQDYPKFHTIGKE